MKRLSIIFLTVFLLLGSLAGYTLNNYSVYAQEQVLGEDNKQFIIDDFEGERDWNAKGARFNDISVTKEQEIVRFGSTALKMDYDFLGTEGVSGVYAEPAETIEIPGDPIKIGMWVYGDGAGHWLRMQFQDAKGQNFNIDLTEEEPNGVNWLGWKYVESEIGPAWTAPFSVKTQGVRYMATNDSMKNKGTIYIDNIIALYEDIDEDVINPEILSKSPDNNETFTNNKPYFEIIVKDEYSGIDFDSTVLKIDGIEVDAQYDNDTVFFQVENALADGLHEAFVEIFDNAGNHYFETWNFTIDSGNFHLIWPDARDSVAGDKSSVVLNAANMSNVDQISFDIEENAVVRNLDFEVNSEFKDNYNNINGKHVFNNLKTSDLDNTDLGKLVYDLDEDATGKVLLKLVNGQYTDDSEKEKLFFVPSYQSKVIQPLSLSIDGISVGTQSTLTVKDLDGNLMDGVEISILNNYKLLKFKQDGEILKSDKGNVPGELFRKTEKDELLVIAKDANDAFPYYRVHLENGDQRYYHVDKDSVEEINWNSLISKPTEDGVLKTDFLTLSQLPIKLQAKKGKLVSQILEFSVSEQLGEVNPENILLTWAGNIQDSLHISWKTNTNEKETQVQIRSNSDALWKTINGTSSLLGDASGEIRVHHVDLDKLEKNTTYQIRVGDGENWSEVLDYTTPNLEKDEFTFTFVADSQAYNEAGFQLYLDTINKAKDKNNKTEFILHAGDIVEEGNRVDQWDMFMKYQAQTGLPFMSVLGNHDVYGDGSNTYNALIKNPDNGFENMKNSTYYQDYGDARFIMLNSEVGRAGMNAQLEWLKETVETNEKAWTIVTFHRAPYKANPKRPDDVTMDVFAPVLEELGVDLVLVGHDHTYMRTHPLSKGEVTDSGTTYITAGSVGPKFYPAEDQHYTAVSYSEEKQVATNFTVSENELSFEAFNIDGEFVDSFALNKEVETNDKLISELKELIIGAEKFMNKDYTEESYTNLRKAIKDSKEVLEMHNADKTQLEKAIIDLELSIEALEKTNIPVNDYDTALSALRKADASRTPEDITLAKDLANGMVDGWQKNRLVNRLNVIEAQVIAAAKYAEAEEAVRVADTSRTKEDIASARTLIEALDDGIGKDRLTNQLVTIEAQINTGVTYEEALAALRTADGNRMSEDIEIARDLVSKLLESWQKTRLENRLVVIDSQEAS